MRAGVEKLRTALAATERQKLPMKVDAVAFKERPMPPAQISNQMVHLRTLECDTDHSF